MSAAHTPGPLQTGQLITTTVFDVAGSVVASTVARHESPTSEHEANARRIVACWNACQTLTTEQVEFIARDGGVRKYMDERDELLSALQARAQVDAAYTRLVMLECDREEHERLLQQIEDAEDYAKDKARAALSRATGSKS